MTRAVVDIACLFLTGLLAGEEFVIRYGVRRPLAALDDRAHLQLRLGLIRTLRVLVPAIALPALVTGVASAVLGGGASTVLGGGAWPWAGVAALVTWFLVTALGTVPINASAVEWSPDAPPPGWKTLVDRWERLNTVRTWAALAAFASFLVGVAVRLGA